MALDLIPAQWECDCQQEVEWLPFTFNIGEEAKLM